MGLEFDSSKIDFYFRIGNNIKCNVRPVVLRLTTLSMKEKILKKKQLNDIPYCYHSLRNQKCTQNPQSLGN